MTQLNVEIRNKTYANGCCAIKNLAFTAQRGEFVAVIGPSGTGKTTLLNLVAGLDQDMAGNISFQSGASRQPKPRIGFMFQEPRLMPWLTVRENLELVLAPPARARPATELQDMLALVGLQGCEALFPGQLSGGMQRRVALLRAFIVEPELLLMDEPFQSLDAPTAGQLRALLHGLWRRTCPTVLFVTHSLREALCLADRVLFFSSRPSRVILDIPVDLAQPRGIEDPSVQNLHATLLDQYPRLLGGCASPRQSAPTVGLAATGPTLPGSLLFAE